MKIEMNKVSKLIIVLSLVSLTVLSSCTSGHIAVKVVKLNKKICNTSSKQIYQIITLIFKPKVNPLLLFFGGDITLIFPKSNKEKEIIEFFYSLWYED